MGTVAVETSRVQVDTHYRIPCYRSSRNTCSKGKDVEDVLTAAASRIMLSSLDGIDNQAKYGESANGHAELRPDAHVAISSVQSDVAFREGYQAAQLAVLPWMNRDLRVSIATEVFSQVASTIATRIAIPRGGRRRTRLGISVGILGTGVMVTGNTLGLSLVVGIVLDRVVWEIIRRAGHDPEAESAKRVDVAINAGAGCPGRRPSGSSRRLSRSVGNCRNRAPSARFRPKLTADDGSAGTNRRQPGPQRRELAVDSTPGAAQRRRASPQTAILLGNSPSQGDLK